MIASQASPRGSGLATGGSELFVRCAGAVEVACLVVDCPLLAKVEVLEMAWQGSFPHVMSDNRGGAGERGAPSYRLSSTTWTLPPPPAP